MLYSAIVRRNVRRSFQRLSDGAYEQVLRQFAPDVAFSFAGTHVLGGERRGVALVRGWFTQLYQTFPGIRFDVREVLVAGWPWDTRVATHFAVSAPRRDGSAYRNEGMQLARLRWGRIIEDRLYEDTQLLASELAARSA
jgi:ketosteroid isomerase-like protein